MIHVALFGYIFTIMVGVVCLAFAIISYRKFRDKLIYDFLVFFSAFSLFIFFYLLVLTYINVNFPHVGFHFLLAVLAVILVCYSFFVYSILHFGHELIFHNPSSKRRIIEAGLGLISLFGVASSFRIDWARNQIVQQMNVGLMLSFAIIILSILYILILKLYRIKNVQGVRKQIYRRTAVLNMILIPGFALDYYLIKTLHLSLVIPLLYVCYSINESSPYDPSEMDLYLEQAGISIREREIIALIMKGYSNRKISDQLYISLSTVKTHVRNIFQKLNVESRFEIISRIKNRQLQ